MKTRTLKIEETGDYFIGKTKPLIRLKGKWLAELGFKPNSKVEVRTDGEQLILTPKSGFTLVEMLMVILIIGIIAAISVPVVRNWTSGVVQGSVSPTEIRQTLNNARDISKATGRDTYFVLDTEIVPVPTNVDGIYIPSNVIPFQSYCLIQYGNVADQPGAHSFHQVTDWQQLSSQEWFSTNLIQSWANDWNTNGVEPLQTVNLGSVSFPSIGFNYSGGVIGGSSVFIDLVFGPAQDRIEPASTNTAYGVLAVDGRTGIVTVEQHKVR